MSEKQEKKSKQKELYDEIKDVAISKQLNFLIGSGASFPAIPLMGQVGSKYYDTDEKKNDILVSIIKSRSRLLYNFRNNVVYKNNTFVNKGTLNYFFSKKYGIDFIQFNISMFFLIRKMFSVRNQYSNFLNSVINILNLSNSRQTPRSANIFTTNYDLFLEKAADELLKNQRFVFNDGASGYFTRVLDGSNYNKTVSYKGLNDNYINEIPSITLIKPHGSVNWNKTSDDEIIIENKVVNSSFVVPPTGHEEQDTFLDNHFHEMLRIFQLELDKPQSVLFVVGFSFQDKHIAKMVKRALQNPELMVYVICFSNQDKNYISTNLSSPKIHNLKFITPGDLLENPGNHHLTLSDLTKIFQSETLEDSSNE
ncbi:SIR2 family protein [Holzapfeliella sp. JNUCC 72]